MAVAATKKKKRRDNPTPAQLRARRAFARMAKARAKAARLKKRNASKKRPAAKRKVATQANRRSTRRGRLKTRVRRMKKRVRSLRGARIGFGNRGGTRPRRNQSEVAELREAFPGVPMEETIELIGPDSAPSDVVTIGDLLELQTSKETIAFEEGEAALSVDADGKLHVLVPALGNQPEFEPREDLGTLLAVTYGADKGDGTGYAPYEHIFGEEGGKPPHLETDRDAMLVIKGGSYHMEEIFHNRRRRNRRRRTTRNRARRATSQRNRRTARR